MNQEPIAAPGAARTPQEISGGEPAGWQRVFQSMKGFPEDRREELHQCFLQGRQSVMENSTGASTLSGADTKSTKSQNYLERQTILPASSPVITKAAAEDFRGVLLRLGLSTGHVLSKDRQQVLSEDLARGDWTRAELEIAAALIPNDAKLMKEINFARTINSGVFAEAKMRIEVQRGRLFSYKGAAECAAHLFTGVRPDDFTPYALVTDYFEVVRVEGDVDEEGLLKTYWMLKT